MGASNLICALFQPLRKVLWSGKKRAAVPSCRDILLIVDDAMNNGTSDDMIADTLA